MTEPAIQHLTWDSEWLGFPVARITEVGFDDSDQAAHTLAQCQNAGIRLLYLVFKPSQAEANRIAHAAGAQLLDTKLTYYQKISAAETAMPPSGTRLIQATAITPALRQLALQSGEHSRFKRDEKIGRTAFETLYTNWLHRTLVKGQVWTVASPDEAIGLLAFAGHDHYASIELLAVAPAARRRGVGHCLVQAARQLAQQQGYAELRVVTQGANQPARRLYERAGFQLLRTEHIYHLWL